MTSNRLRRTGLQLLVLVAVVAIASEALAQRGGRRGGGRDEGPSGRDGFRGPPGGGPGGGPFGGPGGFRGPPGGGPGGAPFGGPDALLSRLDANNNGRIDPDESEGRARFFLQRLMPNANFSRPISIDEIKRAIERARTQRGGPPRGPDGAGRDADRGDRSSSSQQRDSSEPEVRGFGNEFNLISVPGFDLSGKPPVKITDEDRRRADYYLQRYDRNRDGVLVRDEARWSRRIGDFRADADGDGRLTKNEMSTHFARQRAEEEQEEESRSDEDSRGRDGDRDRGRGYPQRRDDDGGEGGSYTVTGPEGRKSYRFSTVEDLLPDRLPSWFEERDADHDGQIAMAEFASDWNESEVSRFNALDANQDGVVTPQECLAGDSTDAPSSRSGKSYSRSDDQSRTEGESQSQTQSESSSDTGTSGIDPKYVRYAEGVIRKYDNNGDTVLEANEWSEMSQNPEDADTNRNGKITAAEYAEWLMKQ